MSSPLSLWKRLLMAGALCSSHIVGFGASAFAPQGGEYPVAGRLAGDQVFPSISLGATGGYLVWQDNATDGDGFGISARRIEANLLGSLGVFRVNQQALGDQQNARVQLLKDGGAVIVWQGGPIGNQDVFARFLSSDGTFSTDELLVNTYTVNQQVNPAVTELANGNVVVVWSSFGQDGSLQGVYGQVLSSSGQKVGAEYRINQITASNQRTPVVAALTGGGYVVAWVSEQRRFENSVDLYARLFSASGAGGFEFLANTTTNLCANPAVVSVANGGFLLAWSQRDLGVLDNQWDVLMRSFSSTGAGSAVVKVNQHQHGSHFAPQIATVGGEHLVAWTSLGQDGSAEGVYGRFVSADLSMSGPEFRVNTSTVSSQMHPAVASDGQNQFLAVWTSFIGGATSFDLFAQRYAPSSITPSPPFVSALSSTRLSVTWPEAGATTVSGYEVYVDGGATPIIAAQNVATVSSLAPSTTHSVRLAYRFVDGSRSALSEAATGTTWGSDENLDGLPDDWQTAHWGGDPAKWPSPQSDEDGDGASVLQEFMAGTNPKDMHSVLRIQIIATAQGNFLGWNTQSGFIYQVQSTTALSTEWADVGAPRFAAGAGDSILLSGSGSSLYYRVKRLR